VSDTAVESQKLTIRLPSELFTDLQRECVRRGVTPSELVRTALASFLVGDAQAARHAELLFEVAKTRSVLVRFLDHQIGEAAADQLVYTAEGDAESYMAKRQRGGG
jgi:hypothetical protein